MASSPDHAVIVVPYLILSSKWMSFTPPQYKRARNAAVDLVVHCMATSSSTSFVRSISLSSGTGDQVVVYKEESRIKANEQKTKRCTSDTRWYIDGSLESLLTPLNF